MKKLVHAALALALLTGSFLGGTYYSREGSVKVGTAAQGERQVLYYVDPMTPSHTSDKPGMAPCGMQMVPIYADEGDAEPDIESPTVPGTVKIDTRKQQLIGLRVGAVEMTAETRGVRTLGRVVPDENRLHRILAGADGWMWDVLGSTTGALVKQDQLMATAYNYQFLTKEQQYLFALDLAERRKAGRMQSQGAQRNGPDQAGPPGATQTVKPASYSRDLGSAELDMPAMVSTQSLGVNTGGEGGVYFINDPVELAKLELYSLGAGDYQVREIARTKKVAGDLEIRSPVTGVVIARNVSPKQRFDKGVELFRVADISRVWVVADVFERDAIYIRSGTKAEITLPGRGKVVEAHVGDILPQFDPATRSYKVRLELDNPDFMLLPDAFVDVEFLVELPSAITVPVDAVINSGMRKAVFVDLGNGYFEPREVKTGWHCGDRVEITEGLTPGEKIVVSGNFLLDSESRMKMAAAGNSKTSGPSKAAASAKPSGALTAMSGPERHGDHPGR